MKSFICVLLVYFLLQNVFAQQPYYDDVNINLEGSALYDELQQKLEDYNEAFDYSDARDVLVFTDEDPDNSNNVLLIYGYDDNDGSCITDRTRNKNNFGGNTCDYNREHVFARSHAVPSMEGNTGIIADPHNIRSSDVQMNGNRGNKKFQDGSGTAGDVGSGNWYPGDEWKGDVARMIMYMYTRYDNQCLPEFAGVGNTQDNTEMLEVFLEWNAEDPVSTYEDQRNDYLETAYGNRNPFIDNPFLATQIWGGPQAEDRWNLMNTETATALQVAMYPNPSFNQTIHITANHPVEHIVFYDRNGKVIQEHDQPQSVNQTVEIKQIPQGFYLVHIQTETGASVKKLIVK